MEGKDSSFHRAQNTGQFMWKLKSIFLIQKRGEKFIYPLPRKADPTSPPGQATPAETIPTEAGESKCPSDIGENTEEKGN